jgi:hypothetical protein
MSLHPAPSPVLPASAEIPASAELPVSTELPASAAIPRTIAPSTQYVRVGEKAPKLSTVPTRQQVHEITQLLLSRDSPFSPIDVVHHNNYELMETLLMKKFATDPPRREEFINWMSWTNQRFCRELNISVPDNAVSKSDKLGFVDLNCQVALEFDIKDPIPEQTTDQHIAKIVRMFPNATAEVQLEATKILIEKLPFEPVNYRGVLHRPLDRTPRLITVNDFRFVWLAQLDRIRDQIEALKLLDIHPSYGEYSHQFKVVRRPPQETKIRKRPRDNEDKGIPPLLCTGCGRKVMLWQHASSVRLRITTRLQHPSLNRQEAKSY